MPKRFFSLELLLSFDTSCKQRSCFQAKQISGRQFLSNFWLNNFSHPSLSAATPLNPSDPISKKAKCLEELSYILTFVNLWKSDQSKVIFSQSGKMFFFKRYYSNMTLSIEYCRMTYSQVSLTFSFPL